MAFVSGKNGRVTIGGNTLKVKQWRVSPKAEPLDVTNTESSGTGEYIAGVTDLDFELQFDYFVSASPVHFPQFSPGLYVSAVCFIGSSSGPSWSFTGFVSDVENTNEVRGKNSVTVRGKSSGGYTAPVT